MVWQECKLTRAARHTVQILSLTLGVNLVAQPEVQKKPGTPASNTPVVTVPRAPASRKFLDGVLMTVDNQVILFSEVRDEFESVRSGTIEAGGGKKLTLGQERQIYQEIMGKFQQNAVRASAALTLPSSTPEQIKNYVDRVLLDEKQNLIKQYGSLNKMREEMSAVGDSSFMIDRKQRENILMNLSDQELRLRLKDRAALMITPKMLRHHYHKVQASRRTESSCDLARLTFGLKDANDPAQRKQAVEKARQAIATWRQGEQTTAEIAEKFGGLALPETRGLTAAKSKEQALFITEFIGRAKIGDVSEPTIHGRAVFVLKILHQQAGSDYSWSDPKVQEQLRSELLAIELRKIQLNAARRDWDKVFRWESPLTKRL
jgi:hypothetical protein